MTPLEQLSAALAELRHDRHGLYGPPLRAHLLARLPISLTARQYRLLRSVQIASPHGLTLTNIAELMLCDRARASRLVDDLQNLGLLQRTPDPADRRRRLTTTTTSGNTLLAATDSMRNQALADLVNTWPDNDITTLAALLARLNEQARRYGT